MPKKYTHGKSTFQEDWLNDEELSRWVQKVPSNIFSAKCRFCPGAVISLSSMGRQALTSHEKGKKHIAAIGMASSPTLGVYMNSGGQPSTADVQTKSTASSLLSDKPRGLVSSTSCERFGTLSINNLKNSDNVSVIMEPPPKKLKTIDLFLKKENVTRAEIIWCLHSIKSHFSLRAAGNSVSLFKIMFPNDEIAQGMQLQKTKVQYYTVYGLGPYFKNILKKKLHKCQHFTVGFDESLNKVAQHQQMDINIRYWDEEKNMSITHYYDSVFLEHTKAQDLLEALKTSLNELNLKKILQLSMDGPNVNFLLFKFLKEDISTEPEDPKLLDIGSCGLHTIHCAFKNGLKATGWHVIAFLRAIYNIFKDVPSRRGDFRTISRAELFPLKFCAIRWLENEEVVERAINLLPKIEIYVEAVKNTSKQPRCQSFNVIMEALQCKLLRAQLAFFQAISAQISPFLREFQSDKPLAPFLYTSLSSLVQSILQQVVKKEVLDKTPLTKIDFNKEIFLDARSIDLGFGTRNALRHCKDVSTKEMLFFREDCKRCLIKFSEKVLTRSPLKFKLTKGLTCLDPKVILSTGAKEELKTTLDVLVDSNLFSGASADRASRQYCDLVDDNSVKEKLKVFSRSKSRLDNFWIELIKTTNPDKDNTDFLHLVKIVCVMSHGNANLERGFSINKECLVPNQQRASLVAQRIVTEAINMVGGVEKINISPEMIHAVRNSRARYEEALKEHKRTEDLQQKSIEAQKKALVRLKELEAEKAKIVAETHLKVSVIQEELSLLKKQISLETNTNTS